MRNRLSSREIAPDDEAGRALDFIDQLSTDQRTQSSVLLAAAHFYELGLEHQKRLQTGEQPPVDEIKSRIKNLQSKLR